MGRSKSAGRRTSMTVAGQPVVNYSYDNANRVTQITQGTSSVAFGYDAAGRRASLKLPNGVAVSYSYDTASQLTGMSYASASTTLGNLAYIYDLAGRRAQVGGSFARTGLPNAVTTTAYNADNQLTQWGTATLTYDANGNILSSGTDGYTWDARNRLMSTLSGASFQYDPFGRRTARTILGTTTNYLYDGVNPVQELSAGTATANLLTGGVDEYLTRTDSAGARNFLAGGLGSTVALTDSTGTIQAQYTYEPFGNTTVTGSAFNPYQYTGRENDGTGLYYYRARYYHPTFQRFVSEDPIEFEGGINLYAYVGNDPLDLADPFGLSPSRPRSCKEKCRRFLRVCYAVGGGAGIGVGVGCYLVCVASLKTPVTCRVLCSAAGAVTTGTLDLGCYAGYLACLKTCKEPKCKQP